MKKYIILLLAIVFTSQVFAQNSWRELSVRKYQAFTDIKFLDDNTGFAVGSKAQLVKTTDGGLTWDYPATTLPVDDPSFKCIQMLDQNTGFIGTEDAQILKTTDGGSTWELIQATGSTYDVVEIYFADVNTGWVLTSKSSEGILLHTTDGGSTWNVVLTHSGGDLESMDFIAANKGIVAGGGVGTMNIYYSTDGTTWTKATNPTLLPVYSRMDLKSIDMITETEINIGGWGSRAAGLQPTIILKSTDGGATWEVKMQPEDKRTYVYFYGMKMVDNLIGYAVGGASYEGTVVCKTEDGGNTWNRIYTPFGFSAKSVDAIGTKIWVTGSNGNIIFSTDAGANWSLIENTIPNTTLYDMVMIGDKIWASGYAGVLLMSDDKGASWTADYIEDDNSCTNIGGLDFVNENVGYAARKNKVVSKTVDGGITWTTVMEDTTTFHVSHTNVDFINENFGVVVGKSGSGNPAVYKTVDGGVNWTESFGMFPNHLNDVKVFDENNYVVVGENKVAGYTTDGGATWSEAPVSGITGSPDFNSVYFLDSQLGIAAGEVCVKTTDGGKTWSLMIVQGQTKEMKSCYMADANNWYIVGDDFIYETTDAGANWTDLADPSVITATSVYSVICDADGNPFVGAATSNIYTTAPLTAVVESTNKLPENYSLEQNYPNPFNPATTIEFSIANNEHVNITVYDVLGKKVAELLNENVSAGSYKLNFDASELTSGIYFYTLSAGSKTFTNKMMLLK